MDSTSRKTDILKKKTKLHVWLQYAALYPTTRKWSFTNTCTDVLCFNLRYSFLRLASCFLWKNIFHLENLNLHFIEHFQDHCNYLISQVSYSSFQSPLSFLRYSCAFGPALSFHLKHTKQLTFFLSFSISCLYKPQGAENLNFKETLWKAVSS